MTDDDELVEFMPSQFPPHAWIAEATWRVSGDDAGNFDELAGPARSVHLEMLDDGTMWMEFVTSNEDRVIVVASAEKRGRLRVKVELNP